ncbi:MAG: hypothetical protein IJV14_13000 [Lachnospiraceae bacterium]|nr:hypothetical protein [Lachnospiraceae bacterium]
MDQNNFLDKMEELMGDADFEAAVYTAESAEDLKAAFAAKGVTVDDEFAKAAFEKMDSILDGGELGPEELALVSGGSGATYWKYLKGGITVGGAAAKLGFGPVGLAAGLAAGSVLGCYYGVKEDMKSLPKRKNKKKK